MTGSLRIVSLALSPCHETVKSLDHSQEISFVFVKMQNMLICCYNICLDVNMIFPITVSAKQTGVPGILFAAPIVSRGIFWQEHKGCARLPVYTCTKWDTIQCPDRANRLHFNMAAPIIADPLAECIFLIR